MRNSALLFFGLFALSTATHAGTVSFDKALRVLVDKDLRREAQRHALDAQSLELEHQRRSLIPDLSTGLSKSWNVDKNWRQQEASDTQAYIRASTNLFAWGRDSAQIKAWKAEEERLQWNRRIDDLEAERRAALLLLQTIYVHKQSELTEKHQQSRFKFRQILQRYYESGRLAKDDVDRFSIDLSQIDFDRENIASQLRELNKVLNFSLEKEGLAMIWPMDAEKLQARLNLILEGNQDSDAPEVSSQEALRAVKSAEYTSAKRSLLPTIDIQSIAGKSLVDDRQELQNSVALTLNIPIFDRSMSSRKTEAKFREFQSQESELAYTRKVIEDERSLLKATLVVERDQLRQIDEWITKALKVLDLSQQRFERGLLSYNDFVLDEDRLYRLEFEKLSSMRKVYESMIRLCHIQGRPWSSCIGS